MSGREKEIVQGGDVQARWLGSTWTLTLYELGSNDRQGDEEMYHPDSPSRKDLLQGRTFYLH